MTSGSHVLEQIIPSLPITEYMLPPTKFNLAKSTQAKSGSTVSLSQASLQEADSGTAGVLSGLHQEAR